MGGPNKLLQFYRGEPLLVHALKSAGDFDFVDRLVVSGRDALAIQGLAASCGFRFVHNPRFEEGSGTSIAAGAAALDPRLAGFFIALGDMPDVCALDYHALAGAFRPGVIVLPVYKGSRGHPVLFCASYRSALAALSGDEGARSIINHHAAAVIDFETANPGALRDFDVLEDFS
jgi:molybdenum cofactor cytidylyltransferase